MQLLLIVLAAASRLEYSAPAGCPDAAGFQARVAARLGHDPFGDEGTLLLRVTFTRARTGYEARLVLLDGSGAPSGERRFEGARACSDLADSVALAGALALDPLLRREADRLAQSAPPPEAAPPPAEPPAAVAKPVPPAPPPASPPAAFSVAGGPLAAVGRAPTPSAGAWLELRAGLGRWSLGLGGRFDAPSSAAVGTGSGQVWGAGAELTPCAGLAWARLCLIGSLGALSLRGLGVSASDGAIVPVGGAGLRFVAEPSLSERWALRFFVDAQVPFSRPSMSYGADRVWQLPWVSATAGLGIAWRVAVTDSAAGHNRTVE